MSDRLRIVIFDDDINRKEQIKEHMPDYMDTIFCGNLDVAKKSIADADKTDLVVLNADEESGRSLSLFGWLKEDAKHASVPVLLLCEDAFSDRVLDFLDIGDAAFYEGDFDPDYFFMQVMETIDEAEMAPDEIEEPSYLEKDPDRILGLSVKPVGEDEDTIKRSIVLQHEEQLQQLDQAIERGRQKQQKLKEIMTLAIKYKEEIRREQEAETKESIKENTPKGPEGLHRLSGEKVESMLSDEEDGRRTIVVIDNDHKNRKLCELFLQSDYRVVLESSGMGAIDYFVKAKADLILLSFRMPILDGLKILDSIRWQPNGKKVPVIFMTDEDIESVRKQCQRERVVGLLTKPVQKNALRRSVDAVLSTIKDR